MDRLTVGKIALALCPLIFVLPFALAEDAKYVGEDYYGNDINAAVFEANKNKRGLNYTRKHWYNRTTSQSFELNPLEKNELETERLEGALGATAAGNEKNTTDPDFPAQDQSEQIQKDFLSGKNKTDNNGLPQTVDSSSIDTQVNLPAFELRFEHPRGDVVTSRGVLTTGTITSTPRP